MTSQKVDDVMYTIFGVGIEQYATVYRQSDTRASDRLHLIDNYLTIFFDDVISHKRSYIINGRIGPPVVTFNVKDYFGICMTSPDRLSITSQTSSCVIQANVGVFQSKWMYEVQIKTPGPIRVGWSTSQSQFHKYCTVGDTTDSYAYDGLHKRKWNVNSQEYGDYWKMGDIIGCAIDLNAGTINFYKNGKNLGRAFENIPRGQQIIYYPTVAVDMMQYLSANFGSVPFKHPLLGYQPFQTLPTLECIKINHAMKWLSHVTSLLVKIDEKRKLSDDKNVTIYGFLMSIAYIIFKHITPLLTTPYIIEMILIPFIERFYLHEEYHTLTGIIITNTCERALSFCLDLFWIFLKDEEIDIIFEIITAYVLSSYRYSDNLDQYTNQCRGLILLMKLCQHTHTRHYLLSNCLFKYAPFPILIYVKALSEEGLTRVIEKPWWATEPIDPTIEINISHFKESYYLIEMNVKEVETLQINFLLSLLNDTDMDDETGLTSRQIFRSQFSNYIEEYTTLNFNNQYKEFQLFHLPSLLCFFHRLLSAIKILWEKEIGTSSAYIFPRIFYDGTINYTDIDRLGGNIDNLKKKYLEELIDLFDPYHNVIVDLEHDTGNINYEFGKQQKINPDQVEPLMELIDSVIFFYHSFLRNDIISLYRGPKKLYEYTHAFNSIKQNLENIQRQEKNPNTEKIQAQLSETMNFLKCKLGYQTRLMAWNLKVIFTQEMQSRLIWLMKVITLTLQRASIVNNKMLYFVPTFHVFTLFNLWRDLLEYLQPMVSSEILFKDKKILQSTAEVLCKMCKDTYIDSSIGKEVYKLLTIFFLLPSTMEAIENISQESKMAFVEKLLTSYNLYDWEKINYLLLCIWRGCGFAFRHSQNSRFSIQLYTGHDLFGLMRNVIYTPCPSPLYQSYIGNLLLNDQELIIHFLNGLLDRLNVSVTIFMDTLREIGRLSRNTLYIINVISSIFKECSYHFNLIIALLRVIEMFCDICLKNSYDWTDLTNNGLTSRLCQLLCLVLNQVTSPTSSFHDLHKWNIPALNRINYFSILTAIIGILLSLLHSEIIVFRRKPILKVPKITQSLLTVSTFEMPSFQFILGKGKYAIATGIPFSLIDHVHVNPREISNVKMLLRYLNTCSELLSRTRFIQDDDNICTICYERPIIAVFKPCDHKSCLQCINQHLYNNDNCFFCKRPVTVLSDLKTGQIYQTFVSL